MITRDADREIARGPQKAGKRGVAEGLLNFESSYAVRANGATASPYVIKVSLKSIIFSMTSISFGLFWAESGAVLARRRRSRG